MSTEIPRREQRTALGGFVLEAVNRGRSKSSGEPENGVSGSEKAGSVVHLATAIQKFL